MGRPPSGAALLLSRVGGHVSAAFAKRLAEHGLTPAQVGVLRVVGQQPGISQQGAADRLGVAPSRLVKLVDELEAAGLVERRRSREDRRLQELHPAPDAGERLALVRGVVRDHDRDVTRGLTAEEVETLVALLAKVASAQGLDD